MRALNLTGLQVATMSDQFLHKKIGAAARAMHTGAGSRHLKQLMQTEEIRVTPRLKNHSKKEYQRALFQAALTGNTEMLNALCDHQEMSSSLVDAESCDNALWVAVAENHYSFALAMLKKPQVRNKITISGVKEVLKFSMEQTQNKTLINALLQFVAHTQNGSAPLKLPPQPNHVARKPRTQ